MQEVTGSSPVPSTKTRASDLGQRLFCCVTHQPTSEQDGTGLEQQRSRLQRRRAPPAAEAARSCWGRGQRYASKAQRMLGAATRLPAAETGRRGWGRVLIFQGPVKGLRKNQQTQLVRAAHLSYSFCRNVCQESTACRSTVCRTSVHAVPDRNNVRQSHSQKTKAGYHHDGGILPFVLYGAFWVDRCVRRKKGKL